MKLKYAVSIKTFDYNVIMCTQSQLDLTEIIENKTSQILGSNSVPRNLPRSLCGLQNHR